MILDYEQTPSEFVSSHAFAHRMEYEKRHNYNKFLSFSLNAYVTPGGLCSGTHRSHSSASDTHCTLLYSPHTLRQSKIMPIAVLERKQKEIVFQKHRLRNLYKLAEAHKVVYKRHRSLIRRIFHNWNEPLFTLDPNSIFTHLDSVTLCVKRKQRKLRNKKKKKEYLH